MNSKYLQPKKYLFYVVKKVKAMFSNLENGGERVDIVFSSPAFLDENEKCHLKRYEFAASYVKQTDRVGDFACGTGYGSALLASHADRVLGIDIDARVIEKVEQKYQHIKNLSFEQANLLEIKFDNEFDCIVSFETIEHLVEGDIMKLLHLFQKAIKQGGKIIISTPYMQKNDKQALRSGFHKTFFINEDKIRGWMEHAGFKILEFYYQSYDWPVLSKADVEKDFIVCVAEKV